MIDILGKLLLRFRRDQRGIPGLESAIVLIAFAALSTGLFSSDRAKETIQAGLDELYTGLYQLLQGSPFLFLASRFAITYFVLIVPTTLMGATLPVLCKFAVERIDKIGWDVGRLYAVNTLGAAAGSFIAAFVLIEAIGVAATIYVAAAINLLIALAAWALARGHSEARQRRGEEAQAATQASPGVPSAEDSRLRILVLVAFGLSGFIAERMPKGTANTTAMSIATTGNSTVTGILSFNSTMTGALNQACSSNGLRLSLIISSLLGRFR